MFPFINQIELIEVHKKLKPAAMEVVTITEKQLRNCRICFVTVFQFKFLKNSYRLRSNLELENSDKINTVVTTVTAAMVLHANGSFESRYIKLESAVGKT